MAVPRKPWVYVAYFMANGAIINGRVLLVHKAVTCIFCLRRDCRRKRLLSVVCIPTNGAPPPVHAMSTPVYFTTSSVCVCVPVLIKAAQLFAIVHNL